MVLVLSVSEGIETFSFLLFECEPKFIHRTKLPLIHQIGYYCKLLTSLGAKDVVWFKTCSKIQYSSILRFFQRTGARVWFVPSLRKGIGLFPAITVVSPPCLFLAKYLGISPWTGCEKVSRKSSVRTKGVSGVGGVVQTRSSAFGCWLKNVSSFNCRPLPSL